ncbi:hypothetical protein BKD30_10630 [Tersicoccus phoenicis]|uniref:TIGR01906 family membrane protein n=1 Tax=Tersicoccus phoenicis TaxID=554083 RepID=A0A1R1L8I5_9MICC|nr:TIGR01906 family membrane protein [Tersicoccus phoenicis]OMH23823.1 hypothetical protein BKD30_10630 [Tersicoccus phoenicis]
MSSRTPRPEDEYPPLDTDDGGRYIPTSRELADQYVRGRTARTGDLDGRSGAAESGSGEEGAGSAGGAAPGGASVRWEAGADGSGEQGGVRVTEPVSLVDAAAGGGAAAAGGNDTAGDGAERKRERVDHATAMDDWDREFGGAEDRQQHGAGARVGSGIVETDARSDAGGAVGATTIDRRTAAGHASPDGEVPAPLGATAVAATSGRTDTDAGVSSAGARDARTAGPVDAADTADEARAVGTSETAGADTVEADEEARRRATRRDAALGSKPAAGRFWQVVLGITFPIVLLAAAVRTVASPLFLWVEYNRPGFPADPYGFTADDRLTWGSAVEDYVNNFANPRYLSQLPGKDGGSLLTEGEVSHMVDVKSVIGVSYIVAAVLLVLGLIAVIYLAKRYHGGVRRGLFAGSAFILVVVVALAVFAVLDWSLFFTMFHRVFFAQGNWTFYENDALIRLFPTQFWIDAGIVIGAIVIVVSALTLILTWPTRRRRERSRAAQEALRRSMADQEEPLAG